MILEVIWLQQDDPFFYVEPAGPTCVPKQVTMVNLILAALSRSPPVHSDPPAAGGLVLEKIPHYLDELTSIGEISIDSLKKTEHDLLDGQKSILLFI